MFNWVVNKLGLSAILEPMSINWILLFIGGLFETGFAISLGKAQEHSGKEFWFWIIAFGISVSISMYLLFKAMLWVLLSLSGVPSEPLSPELLSSKNS